jgi:hypothetical protein
MRENKTKPNDRNISEFINSLPYVNKRADAFSLMMLLEEISGETPQMWGDRIVGFGTQMKVYKSGRVVEWYKMAFSANKRGLTIYLETKEPLDEKLFTRLGKFKQGKGCIYLNKLSDVDQKRLRKLLVSSYLKTA